jgi:hypothetical protein
MNNNTGRNIGIIISVGFIIQLIFRWMGDGNKAVIAQGIILTVSCIMLAFCFMTGTTKKRLGNILNIIGTILISLVGIVISVIHISSRYYPEFHKDHKKLIINILIGTLYILVIYFMVAAGIVSDRKHK